MAVRSPSPSVVDTVRAEATGTVALAAVGAAAFVVASLANPATIEDGPVVCPFRRLTGLPCPGCGMTRSWVYLAHGDWSSALHANPFGYLTLAGVLALVGAVLVAAARRMPAPSLTPVVRSRGFRLVVAAWVGFAIVRAVAILATGGG